MFKLFKCKLFQTSSGAAETRIIAATGHVFNALMMLTAMETGTVLMEAVTADQVPKTPLIITKMVLMLPEQQHQDMMILCATMVTAHIAVPIKQP